MARRDIRINSKGFILVFVNPFWHRPCQQGRPQKCIVFFYDNTDNGDNRNRKGNPCCLCFMSPRDIRSCARSSCCYRCLCCLLKRAGAWFYFFTTTQTTQTTQTTTGNEKPGCFTIYKQPGANHLGRYSSIQQDSIEGLLLVLPQVPGCAFGVIGNIFSRTSSINFINYSIRVISLTILHICCRCNY